MELIEPAAAKMRHHHRFDRRGPWEKHTAAYQTNRQARFAAALHEKAGEVERIHHVSRLKLVETSPHEPGRSSTQVEARRDDVDVQIRGAHDDISRCSGGTGVLAIRNQPVNVSSKVDAYVATEFVVPLGKHAHPELIRGLPPRCLVKIRQRVEHDRHMAVDLRRGRCRSKKHEDRRGLGRRSLDEGGERSHAADPSRATARAPKIRGNSMMTAGTTSTSARNATTIVSASRPPNQAVGL